MDTQVMVAGAGPVGLMLAGELRLGGADVVVLERLERPGTESRASTLHARTMEILDSRGLLDAFGDLPTQPRGHFGGIPLDLTLPGRYPGQWKVPQTRTERLLQDWATGLGADVRRGWELLDLLDDGAGVVVTAGTPAGLTRLRAPYLVGCDGEDSTVRALTGAPFPGEPASRELLRADVAGVDIPNRRFERLEHGLAIAARNRDGVTRVMVHEFGRPAPTRTAEPDFTELVDSWKRVTGEDLSTGRPLWVNAFGDANRQLTAYRHGRVLLAGDAAHQQMPIGGQALNLGLQDAVNLGWKLAAVATGRVGPELLDTYSAERQPVGRRVLAAIRAQALMLLEGREIEPIRGLVAELLTAETNRAWIAGMISGLDVRYDVGPGPGPDHPLVGARLPETGVRAGRARTTTTALLRTGRGVLLAAAGAARLAAPWAGRVVAATLPRDAGLTPDPADVVLVRPDGHVAWIGADPDGARAALRRWFGPARTARRTATDFQGGK
ncbi:MAG: FAD-dependent monooxygenase [Mycobacteriales bacterium]